MAMRRLTSFGLVSSVLVWAGCLVGGVSAHDSTADRSIRKVPWTLPSRLDPRVVARARAAASAVQSQGRGVGNEGRRLFEEETFGGNGRTCVTCHSKETGTVSPEDAQARFAANPNDPLFRHDGSDDGLGNGVSRMLADATVLIPIRMHANVELASDPSAQFVTLRRGIPTTINTPGLDPVLMLDGRQPDLHAQASGAIHDHGQNTVAPTTGQLDLIARFQLTDRFFSSTQLKNYANGAAAPKLPPGTTASERRGRRFFEDLPPDDATFKDGLCANCHSGPLLNQTNQFLPVPIPVGSRFQTILVSELNVAGNPVLDFNFTNPDGSITVVSSPDPGRALITGRADDQLTTFDHTNAFKIPSLRGVARTAPYFHDNSAKSLEDVLLHYQLFFDIVTGGFIHLDARDMADIIAYMKLLK